MIDNENELRKLFTSSSLGLTAYRTWALQARHERRFNVARLFEALAAAKIGKAEFAFRQLGEDGSTMQNVGRALHGLEPEAIACGPVTGTSPLTRDMLQRAQVALAEERDLYAHELGDIYVCTICGFMREGELRGACPQCGTVPEAHRAFRAIEAMGTCGPHAIVHSLEIAEGAMRTLLLDLSDEILTSQLDHSSLSPHAPHSALKVLAGHLLDIDAVFRARVKLLLDTNHPNLSTAHPPKLDSAAGYLQVPIDQILDQFHESRRQTLALLRGLTHHSWHRKGHHEIYGEIDLLHQGNWMISHERSHLIEMAQIRHDLLLRFGAIDKALALVEPVVLEDTSGE
jgi:rubrerythrin